MTIMTEQLKILDYVADLSFNVPGLVTDVSRLAYDVQGYRVW